MADPKIRFKRSSVQGKTPTVEQLPLGETALNTFDGRLYVSKSTDSGLTTSVVNVSGFNLQEEGTFVGYANTVNFVGGTISVGVDTNVGIATVTVSGGGVGISSAGNRIGTGFTDLNFVGTGVSIVGSGTTVSIQVEPGLVGAAKSVTSFTATTSQTTFNVNYSQGQENVFLNGVRLSESQYTATNGSTVVLSDPAADGDSVDIVVYLRGADPNRNTKVTLLPSFNGITTAFTMFQGTTSYLFEPIDERQIIVSLGGVIQQPGVAYTVGTGSSIFFSDAPGIAATCFITALFSNTVGVPTDAVKLNKQVYTPSGIQTSFTVTDGYLSGYLDVYRNGIRLVDGSDFTASNGTTFSLTTPATGGDVVDIIAYKTLNISYAEFARLSTNVDGGYGSLTNLQVSGISTFAGITTVTGTTLFTKQLSVSGIVTAQDFDSLSDRNYKENVITVNNALLKVEQLRGVKFNWKESGSPSYGVIAQELEQVLPELVHGENPRTVNYNGIIGVLIEAIKELKVEIKNLKNS